MKRLQTSLPVAGILLWVQLMLLSTFCTALFAQEVIWAKKAGGTSIDQGKDLAVDSLGNSYVTGYFFDTATFGAGETNQTALTSAGEDIFVAKYNSNGTLAWAKKAGGTGDDDQGLGIAVDGSGNSYVTGYFLGTATFGVGEANQTVLTSAGSVDIFVAKYNSNGTLAWAKKAGGTGSDRGLGIAVDGSGNSYVAGWFNFTATFGAGEANQTALTSTSTDTVDIFVAKYNSDGTLAWAKKAGGTSIDQGLGIAVDGSGNSYVTGWFGGTATFGAGEANQTTLTSAGDVDIFVAKYNSNGTLAWAKKAGGTGIDQGFRIAVDVSGNSYVTGFFSATASFGAGEANQTALTSAGFFDIFIAKYNSDGTLAWAKKAGGANLDEGQDIAVDGSGNSYVTGWFNLTATFGAGEANQTALSSAASQDIFLAKYNSDGTLAWAKKAGGTGIDQGLGIAVDGSGNSYVTGRFADTTTFGADETNQTALTSAGSDDIFVAKFSAKRSQAITFGALAGKTFGDPAFNVSATATSNLAVSFGAQGNCSVVGTLVTITGAGSCTITASQAGDATYFAAPDVPQTFAIAKATPVITWSNPADISQGTALSSTQLNATVTFNGSNVSGTFNYNPVINTVLPLGNNQQLTLNFTPVPDTNYTPAQKVVSINVVDTTAPVVLSILRVNTNPTNATSVRWTVSFSENVTGVDATDFTFAASGVTGASITNVTGSNNFYVVTVDTGSGSGTLGLNLSDDDTIKDLANNALGGAGAGNGNFTGQAYTFDRTAPDTNITSGPTGTIGVNTATFQYSSNEANSTFECSLDNVAFSSCPVAGITYNSLASTNHTFQVRAIDSVGNIDASPASQSFTVDTLPPTVQSIVRANPSPTNAGSVSWTVTFSENVTGVDATDFALAQSGVSGALITNVSGVNAAYTVTANTGTGSGTLGLNVSDDDTIKDLANNALGGTGAGNGNFTGEVYTIDRTAPDTNITSGPTGTITVNTATFQYSSTDANSTFECSLDNVAFSSCPVAGITYNGLAPGNHTFQVRAIDALNNVDPSPANQSFTFGPAITVAPGSAVQGGSVTATWSGIISPSPTDWIGLYQVGAPNSPFWDWEFVSCSKAATVARQAGTCSFPIPSPPNGTYELRLFSNNGFTRLATSNPFTIGVVPILPLVTVQGTNNAAEPSINGSFTVNRSIVTANPLTVNYTVTGSATPGSDYTPLSGAVTIPANAATAPITVSPIEDNVFEGNETVIVTLTGNPAYALGNPSSATVQITDDETAPAGPSISVTPGTVVRGGTVTVTWNGIVSPSATDWIGLYQVGTPNSPFWEWEYVSCAKAATTARVSGTCTFPIPVNPPAGNFNLRLFSNNGFTLLATSNTFVLQ